MKLLFIRNISFAVILTFFATCIVFPISAAEVINNKFGIHLAQPSDTDIERARELVNGDAGGWGHVTLVIHADDKDVTKWQDIFDKLRARRLIPIMRLATTPRGENWERAKKEDANDWANFLNKLNWVVKKRYIILFNEPNHATEWGGEVDADSYADVAAEFAKVLKSSNEDNFIMMAGLDVSAPESKPNYMDAGNFFETVVTKIGADNFNKYFDGLSSHSYPNPGFSGSAFGSGRGSVKTYEWELGVLESLGVKDLPVFITETGWNGDVLSRSQIAENFRYAYEQIWLPDARVVAVTPFVLNYQGEPFLKFSWVKFGEEGVYPEFDVVSSLEKKFGRPELIEKGEIFFDDLPTEIVEKSTYHLRVPVKNDGQAIWSPENGYGFLLDGHEPSKYLIGSFNMIKPGETKTIDLYINTDEKLGNNTVKLVLYRDEEPAIQSDVWSYEVVPLPSLFFNVSLFPKFDKDADEFELQIFNQHEELVFSRDNLSVREWVGSIEKVDNIALGKKYRVVLLKKHYLPRQTYATFKKDKNEIEFDKMLPLDFNGDGGLTWGDLGAMFKNLKLLGLWWF